MKRPDNDGATTMINLRHLSRFGCYYELSIWCFRRPWIRQSGGGH